MFGGEALGWMAGTLIWMPGACRANVSPLWEVAMWDSVSPPKVPPTPSPSSP